MSDFTFQHTFENGKKVTLFVHNDEDSLAIKGKHDIDDFNAILDEWFTFGASTAETLRQMHPKNQHRDITNMTADVFTKIALRSHFTDDPLPEP